MMPKKSDNFLPLTDTEKIMLFSFLYSTHIPFQTEAGQRTAIKTLLLTLKKSCVLVFVQYAQFPTIKHNRKDCSIL